MTAMAAKPKMKLKISKDPAVGYLYLAGHPGSETPGCIADSIRLDSLIGKYEGPMIVFDFDKDKRLIGIEIAG